MLLKKFPKLFYQSSRLISDSVKRNRPILNKPVDRNTLFEEIFEPVKTNSVCEWKLIRQDLIKNRQGNFTENNVDALILGHCISKNNFLLGSSYINFLETEDIKFSLAAIGKYFKLFYLINKDDCFVNGFKLKKEEEKLVLKRINSIKQKYEILDSITIESAITALSLTKDWKRCIDLLEEIKITSTPNGQAYSTTIAAAFLNKEENLAWQLLSEMVISNKNVDNIVYHAYLNYLKRHNSQQNFIFKLEKLFQFIQENDILLESAEVPLKLADFGNKVGLPSSLPTVNSDGLCRGCNIKLEKYHLSNADFDELKSALLKNVIIGKDVFSKTDPREIEKFKDFINENEKFDVVLDGLNIGYSAGTKHSPQIFSAIVASVVSYFAKQGKKILVVGRYHMNKWPRDNWNYITKNSTVFLTQDISQDDPYLLYCALNSGKDTIIVTRDLMRSHKFLLKNAKLKILFNRWLSQRQYQLLRVGGTGSPIFRLPPPFTITAQKNVGTWHIPFKNPIINNPSNIGWLCVQC